MRFEAWGGKAKKTYGAYLDRTAEVSYGKGPIGARHFENLMSKAKEESKEWTVPVRKHDHAVR